MKLICYIFLALLASNSAGNELSESYTSALQACVELGGPKGTSMNLGIDDNLWYYTNVARLDASKKLWNSSGVAYLRVQLRGTKNGMRRACVAQLLREARRRRLDR